MLDHLSRGRIYWGIGHRAIPTDLSLFGVGTGTGIDVRERSAEALDVILKIWEAEGKFTYNGKYFQVDAPELDPVMERGLHMKPYQQPHPPIGVAATSLASGSIRIAGERGWIPMSSSNLAPQHLRDHWTVVEGKGPPKPARSAAVGIGALAGTSLWPALRSWQGNERGRCWAATTSSTSCPTARVPACSTPPRLTRKCPTRRWTWTT